MPTSQLGATRLNMRELTFFMIPALRLENVICRRLLSVMYSIRIFRRLSPSSPVYVKPPG